MLIGAMFRSTNDALPTRVVNLPSRLLSGWHVKIRSRTFYSKKIFYCQVVNMYVHVRGHLERFLFLLPELQNEYCALVVGVKGWGWTNHDTYIWLCRWYFPSLVRPRGASPTTVAVKTANAALKYSVVLYDSCVGRLEPPPTPPPFSKTPSPETLFSKPPAPQNLVLQTPTPETFVLQHGWETSQLNSFVFSSFE